MEMRKMQIGDHVFFITERRQARHALITAIHGTPREVEIDGKKEIDYPCVNVVFVVPDARARDDNGRQIDRDSSCVHIRNNSAGAHCFCFAEEWTGAPPFDFSDHYVESEPATTEATA